MKQQIEALVFYGTNDEAYELFRATCSLCYQMNGLGYDEQAEILYIWAKNQAVFSKEWALHEFGLLDEIDSEKGIFGY